MRKMKQEPRAARLARARTTAAASALVGCAIALAAGAAQAGVLGAFSGVSEFSQPCGLCDSTVNFTVYQNTDGNWTDDAFFAGGSRTDLGDLSGKFLATVDSSAKYVYMYQVVNTNQTPTPGVADSPLRNFNIALNSNLVTGAGFFAQVFTDQAGLPVDGVNYSLLSPNYAFGTGNALINDGIPSAIVAGAPGGLAGTTQPVQNPVDVRTGLPMSNPGPLLAFSADSIIFEWGAGSNELDLGETSGVLFFTSNAAPSFNWSETESVGGFGAGNDVPTPAPEPATLAVLGAALAGLGVARRRR